MDKSERRRQKKIGKEIVAQRGAELRKALEQANPAPIGSDAWIQNYKLGTQNERWVRVAQPLMYKHEWKDKFIVRVDETPGCTLQQMIKPVLAEDGMLASALQSSYGVLASAELFFQCVSCETVMPSLPASKWFYWKGWECNEAKALWLVLSAHSRRRENAHRKINWERQRRLIATESVTSYFVVAILRSHPP